MPYFCTPADMIRYFGSNEMAQRAGNELLPLVSGDLFEATIYSQDRSAWTSEEQTNADLALTRLNQILFDSSDYVASFLRAAGTDIATIEDNVPHAIRRATADVARYKLYDDGCPPEVEKAFDDQASWLGKISSGDLQPTDIVSTKGNMQQWVLERS